MGLIELAKIDSAAEAFGQLLDAPALKYIRHGTQFAHGSTKLYHVRIAEINNLPIIYQDGSLHCHDAGRIQFKHEKITIFENTSTFDYMTEDGRPVYYPNYDTLGHEEFVSALKEYNGVVEAAHRATCQLLVAVANVLPTQPEIFWTTSTFPEDAVIYQS